MAGAMPSCALVVLPVILVYMYVFYRRFGIYFPLACAVAYGAAALVLNYDILTVVYFVSLLFAFCGLVASAQFSSYLACAVIAAAFAIAGALAGAGIVRLALSRPISDIAYEYVIAERNDPIIGFFAAEYYEDFKFDESEVKLDPSDKGYKKAAAVKLAEWARDEFEYYLWYYCIHYGAIIAVAAYLFSVPFNRRTSGCYDFYSCPQTLKKSVRTIGGVRTPPTAVADMRMPRAYLWTCVLPAALTGVVLEFIGGYDHLSATVMHLFVTVPSAFCFFTLLAFFASLFKGRARYVAYFALYIIGAAMMLFPIALFIGSVIGVCDCILNLRFWTRFIMED